MRSDQSSHWLDSLWRQARRRGVPLCLMHIAADHAVAPRSVAEAARHTLEGAAHGPGPLAAGVALAFEATSPENAYRDAYRLCRTLAGTHHAGVAFASPAAFPAQALSTHAGWALQRALRDGVPVNGMDILVS